MKKTSLLALCLAALFSFVAPAKADPPQFNVLLFTKMDGFHHKSVNEGVRAMRKMAEKHHFNIDWHEDANHFNDDNLARYDAIVFLMTTGDILNEEQQAAMKRFIQAGNGFVGIHSASDTMYGWEWYTKLVGRTFKIHPVIQTAELEVVDHSFPGTERMPKRFLWTDEFYDFGPELSENLNYILTVDEDTYSPAADWGRVSSEGMGEFHPLAWYQYYDGGRSFYTALGHVPATFGDDLFLEHIYGGLYWAATGRGIRD
ncbi:ThuA domain-containing protein [Marinimicrobium sp. ABcell2]|uniref:ThuA domain-containing protein n=1 Tax=Marinimicrobium sp. ABcell2 TaxID=3069751 RepID=UPI0027B24A40|nr:ThuA domain-containing protein [Marinimicrobium sp. ABcell2]MDQ2076150.1 ThuA domain-containing protein [Marinimicrobium sp. ABcell2]